MPTKERLAKERERKAMRKQAEDHIRQRKTPLSPEFLARSKALVTALMDIGIYGTNRVKFDENGDPYWNDNPAKESNDRSAVERRAEALRLKEKYPEQWGKRGGPKCIAIAEGIDMTNTNDNPVRKIQRYRKDFP